MSYDHDSVIPAGAKLRDGDYDWCVAAVCPCGKSNTHWAHYLRRYMPKSLSIDHMVEALTSCRLKRSREHCHVEFISPDDGVAMEG